MKHLMIFILSLTILIINQPLDSRYIAFEDIFSIQDKLYYCYFYLDGCLACRNTTLFLKEVQKRIDNKIYYINLLDCNFSKVNETNIGVNDIDSLYIKSGPWVIKIYDSKVVDELKNYQEIRNSLLFFI